MLQASPVTITGANKKALPVAHSLRCLLRRSYWNHYHHNVGRVAVLAAFANAMLGFKLGNLDWGWYLGLCLIWALIWLLGGAKAFYDHRRARHAAFLKNSSSLAQGGPSNGTELTRQKSEGKYTML